MAWSSKGKVGSTYMAGVVEDEGRGRRRRERDSKNKTSWSRTKCLMYMSLNEPSDTHTDSTIHASTGWPCLKAANSLH